MRKILSLFIILLSLACSKQKFEEPVDYSKLVGTWESINSDEKIYIEFSKDGLIKLNYEIQRSFKLHCIKGTKNESIKTFYFETKNLKTNFGISYNDVIDTLKNLYRFSDQEDNSIDQSIYYIKIK